MLFKRDVIDTIRPYIGDQSIIVLHGARQVGKSHILFYLQQELEQKGETVFYYDLEYPDVLMDMNKGVQTFIQDLKGRGYQDGHKVHVLIDEIQYLENPSSFLKIIGDHHKNIHLIVSGSSSFEIKSKFTDSLAGRTINFEVFPLTFSEFLTFKQETFQLTEAKTDSLINRLKNLYREFILYGGYPKIVLEPDLEKKKRHLFQIIDTYVRKDVRDLAEVEDIQKFNNLIYVLASQSGKLVNMASLARETRISFPTLQHYLFILEATCVIKLVSPFSKNPGVEISKNPKIMFYDSGLQSLLWLKDFQKEIIGSVFETNVFGELVKKHGREQVHYWRTKHGQEIDFVIEKGEAIQPVEVKVNFDRFSNQSTKSFHRRYKTTEWQVVSLDGTKRDKHYVYPWEL